MNDTTTTNDRIIALYNRWRRSRIYDISYYRELSKLVREAKDCDTILCEVLKDAWEATDTGLTCTDSMRKRFIAVIAMIHECVCNGN
jgi:hypothetical protein